jgi:hypothetical protein
MTTTPQCKNSGSRVISGVSSSLVTRGVNLHTEDGLQRFPLHRRA